MIESLPFGERKPIRMHFLFGGRFVMQMLIIHSGFYYHRHPPKHEVDERKRILHLQFFILKSVNWLCFERKLSRPQHVAHNICSVLLLVREKVSWCRRAKKAHGRILFLVSSQGKQKFCNNHSFFRLMPCV